MALGSVPSGSESSVLPLVLWDLSQSAVCQSGIQFLDTSLEVERMVVKDKVNGRPRAATSSP